MRSTTCVKVSNNYRTQKPATEEQIRAAALQFVRKVSGYWKLSKINHASFDQALEEVIAVMQKLLDNLAGLWVAEEGSVVGMAGLLHGHIDMFLDLTEERNQGWKDGITIHGHAFRY